MRVSLRELSEQSELMPRVDSVRQAQAERQRIRDQFAAAALAGLLARPDIEEDPPEYRFLCESAYRWADAMIIARKPEEK